MFRGGRQGLSPHPLFDGAWYLEQHPVVARLGINPLFHFYAWGAARGASPHPLFDSEWYLSRNPDVAAARATPFLHYLLHGAFEGREIHPFFDGSLYFDANPDVRRAGFDPLEHFIRYGKRERRQWRTPFSAAWYLAQDPTADESSDPPIVHYLKHGLKKGMTPSPYGGDVLARAKALANATSDQIAALERPPFFDEALYVGANMDVAQAIRLGHVSSGFEHFLKTGRYELARTSHRRLPVRIGERKFDYDEDVYVANNPDVRNLISTGRYASGFEHFAVEGYAEALAGHRTLVNAKQIVEARRVIDGVGQGRDRRHIAIFAHYDADGVVDEYVYDYLAELTACDVDIVFVTPDCRAADIERLSGIARCIIIKNDAGRDFGSWYIAWKTLGEAYFEPYQFVIFANDSVYLPVAPLKPVFEKMIDYRYNMWGIVDSREQGIYHIQSWFLAFDKQAVEQVVKPFAERFERNVYLKKSGQIAEYEYGLSQLAVDANLAVGAFCAVDDIREDVVRLPELRKWRDFMQLGVNHINQAHDLWDLIIGRYGCPALKLELMRDNPREIEGTENWLHVVDGHCANVDVIAAHMNRQKQSSTVTRLKKVQAPAINVHDLRILDRVKGCGLSGARRLVLLGLYDPQGIVDNHIMKMIASLRGAGCDVVTVTSSKSEEQIERVRRDSAIVLLKDDIGRDFGSWSLALESEREAIAKAESTIWMNDSIYFPLFDPAEMFDEMDRRNLDMWGIVDSHLVRWHVMSWFWSFNRRAQSNGLFDWYLKEYNPEHPKWAQIRNYEMRIPQMVKAAGHKVGAYIEAAEVLRHVRQNLPDHPRFKAEDSANVMHEFWDVVISKYRCPAIKVELVRDNPLGVDLAKLYETVARTDYDPNLIRDHIRRLRTGGVRH